ncbi:carboxymuconolactone decarboxylase family protein [Chloroflexota bacterium]
MDERAKELIAKMEGERGFGMPWRRILAELDPEFMEAIHKLNMHTLQRKDGLPRKYVELIQCVTNALTFHEPGFRVHLRNALNEGIKITEVIQALEICTGSGIHYTSKMLPALEEVVQQYKEEQKK